MKIMFVGDINLGEYYLSFGHGPRSFLESENVFSSVQSVFSEADFVVGNLEAAITDHGINPKDPESMVLRGNPEHAHILKEAGFKILQLANNHSVQHGDQGFDDTVKLLTDMDIGAVGLLDENLCVVEYDEMRIGFLAASDVPDNTNVNQTKYQPIDEKFLLRVEQEAKKLDHLIVMLHWGLESSTAPLPYQRQLAQRLEQAGVSAIIGSHPHLFYEIEKRNRFVCAYSLGNFVFDQYINKDNLKSGILELEITGKEVQVWVRPVELQKDGCLPVPTGARLAVEDRVVLYELGAEPEVSMVRKTLFLLKSLMRGRTRLKILFLKNKILRLLKLQDPPGNSFAG